MTFKNVQCYQEILYNYFGIVSTKDKIRHKMLEI